MASFDLGSVVRVTRVVAAGTPTAYRVSQELLQGYHRQGFAVHVRPCDEPELDHPSLLEGEFSKSDGTRVSAVVRLTPGVPASGFRQTEVDVKLSGRVVVGGAKGMFATAPMVQKIAREKLEGYLDQVLAGVPPEQATPARSEEAPAATEAGEAPAADVETPAAPVESEPADAPDAAETASIQRAAEVARHDSEIARIEAEVLAAEAKLAEKQAEVEALEAEVAAEDAAQGGVSQDLDHDAVIERIERDIAKSEAAVREATGEADPVSADPVSANPVSEVESPFDAVGAFGAAAAEAFVNATNDALSMAESLVGAGARVFGGQSEALTRATDLPPPEPLPPSEPPPAPDALPSSERPPEPDPIPAAEAPALEERLAKAKNLFDKGLISEEEYRTKKTELLERFF